LKLTSTVEDPENLLDFIALNYDSPPEEEIYGLGLQYTEWNFKGKQVPIISSEQGVGRGIQPLTFILNVDGHQGGNSMTTYSPSYTHITSLNRAMVFDTTSPGYLDFSSSEKDTTKALFWRRKSVDLFIHQGTTPKVLLSKIAKTIGTMKPLPEWALDGAVVGL